MKRREFSAALAGACAAAAALPLRAFVADAPGVSAEARALYRKALVLDCNSGPPGGDTLPLPQADLDMARDSGITAVKLSLGGINSGFAETVAEIAQEADTAHGSFYNHFETKEDILAAVLEEMLAGQFELLRARREHVDDPAERVSVAHRHLLAAVRSDP